MEKQGRGLVVVEALLNYRRPAFFDDELTLRTELADLGKCSPRATPVTPASTSRPANPSGCP
jgi:acyl-CoA thioesterase FadM